MAVVVVQAWATGEAPGLGMYSVDDHDAEFHRERRQASARRQCVVSAGICRRIVGHLLHERNLSYEYEDVRKLVAGCSLAPAGLTCGWKEVCSKSVLGLRLK